ncbi:hypothetical protein NL676_005593 [Syzygium grande]|nr:hypothetical protein NL676_005593 [Syzygium grande]
MDSPLLSPRAETCETNENCIVPINGSLEHMPSDEQRYWKNPSIYTVPASITNLNLKAYQPQVVSFGPFHHDKDLLRPMEEHKRRALLHFLNRSGKSLEPFRESLREVARDLKERYDVLDKKWNEGTGDQFLELMIRDGCFMIEIMRTSIGEKRDYEPSDPIFSIHRLRYISPYISRDMLMLENQLPMLVLYRLVAVENNGEERDEYINELILRFYSLHKGIKGMGRRLHVVDVFREGLLMEPENVQHEMENGDNNNLKLCSLDARITGMVRCLLHVLDVFRKCLVRETEEVQHEETVNIVRPATELNVIGIQFKKSQTRSLKGIFFAGGVLRLPVIKVDDTTESIFLNLMTFERLHIGAGNEITAYITFMDNIINNEGDVALLHAQGIIQNAIGSDKAVAKLFNSLCKEVPLASNSSLDAVQENISKYCKKPWNMWRANLKHTYFRNPWSVLSLIAAIFLFALTIVQTIYIVLSYN